MTNESYPLGGAPPSGSARPPLLEWSSWLGLANAVCGIVVPIYGFAVGRTYMAELNRAYVAQGYFANEEQATAFADAIRNGTLVFLALLTVAWMTLVVLLRTNRNWARITLTVLCAIWLPLAILSLVLPLYGDGGVISKLIILLQVLLLIAQLVTMNHRNVRTYFVHRAAQRHREQPP